jgi:Na+-driven multidrug efflux pump
VGIFFASEDAEVIKIAAYGAMIYSFTFPVQGLNILASGYFTAIGNAKLSIIISLLKGLVFIALGLAILPPIFGVDGIWVTVPLAEYLTLGVSFYLVARAVKSLGREDKSVLNLPV